MPQVPVYGEQRVQESALPNVRMGADTSLDTFGGGKPLEAAGDAIQGVEKTVTDIASQEKQKADSLAALAFDNQLSQTQTKIQVAASKMQGKDALGAPDYVNQSWNDAVNKIQSQATNDAQKMAIARAASSRFQELNRFAQVHVGDQMQKFADNETQSYIENSRTSAIQNANDPDKVEAEKQRTTAATYEFLSRKGIPLDSDQGKALLQNNLSNLNKSVLQALLDKDSPTNVEDAKNFLETHKDQFTGQDLIAVKKAVDTAETTTMGLQAWETVKGMKLSDGKPDEARMESAIMHRSDLSDERKLQIAQFVKARAKEEIVQSSMREQASDRSFSNQVYQARKNGVPLEDALKLVPKFSQDNTDQAVKSSFIQKVYAPPSETNPAVYVGLREQIDSGNATKADIDAAYQKNLINTSDWEHLRDTYFKNETEGKNPRMKIVENQIKDLAEATYSDRKKRDEFLHAIDAAAYGKSPEERWNMAQDLIKKDPATESHFLWLQSLPFGGKDKWEAYKEQQQASTTAWGLADNDIGREVRLAIGNSFSGQTKKAFQPSDLSAFAVQMGGYDKIKAGTPINNAIQSLMRKGKVVTPATIQQVLNRAPDGNLQ